MTQLSLNRLLAISFLLLGLSQTTEAALIAELEADGTLVNNSLGTAQAIPESAFTLPVPGTVFNPPGFATATIQGNNGDTDVDFFRFSAVGGQVYLDMDNLPAAFDPIVALFDSTGTLIAYGDDSALDSGSDNTVDSFVGLFSLPGAGTYYVGVSQSANFPTAALTGTETPLVRPDGGFGGYAVSGVTPGISSYDFNGAQPGSATYTLHISAQSEVPEPGSLALSGAALVLLSFAVRRCRATS